MKNVLTFNSFSVKFKFKFLNVHFICDGELAIFSNEFITSVKLSRIPPLTKKVGDDNETERNKEVD